MIFFLDNLSSLDIHFDEFASLRESCLEISKCCDSFKQTSLDSMSLESLSEVAKDMMRFYIDVVFYQLYQQTLSLSSQPRHMVDIEHLPNYFSRLMNQAISLIESIITDTHVSSKIEQKKKKKQ